MGKTSAFRHNSRPRGREASPVGGGDYFKCRSAFVQPADSRWARELRVTLTCSRCPLREVLKRRSYHQRARDFGLESDDGVPDALTSTGWFVTGNQLVDVTESALNNR